MEHRYGLVPGDHLIQPPGIAYVALFERSPLNEPGVPIAEIVIDDRLEPGLGKPDPRDDGAGLYPVDG